MDEKYIEVHSLEWFEENAYCVTLPKYGVVFYRNINAYHSDESAEYEHYRKPFIKKRMLGHPRFHLMDDYKLEGQWYVGSKDYCPAWIVSGIFTRRENPEKFI